MLKFFIYLFYILLYIVLTILINIRYLIKFLFQVFSAFRRDLSVIFWAMLVDFLYNSGLFIGRLLIPLGPLAVRLTNRLTRIAEGLCFIFYFLWEICLLKEHKSAVYYVIYLLLSALCWAGYLFYLFFWYDCLWICVDSAGFCRCSQMFANLSLFTLLFLELRRRLRQFHRDHVL